MVHIDSCVTFLLLLLDCRVSCARVNRFLVENAQDNFIQIFDRRRCFFFFRLSLAELFYVCACANFFDVVGGAENKIKFFGKLISNHFFAGNIFD